MAQPRRKRRSKHRGTAAGTIETRGRTGRPLTASERGKPLTRAEMREKRMSTPPTWSGSFKRALFASILMFLFLYLLGRGKDRLLFAALFAVFALALYVPTAYYLEMWMWRRHQRKKAAAGGRAK
jgi:hypothetical protein